jgi:hypothetical protein
MSYLTKKPQIVLDIEVDMYNQDFATVLVEEVRKYDQKTTVHKFFYKARTKALGNIRKGDSVLVSFSLTAKEYEHNGEKRIAYPTLWASTFHKLDVTEPEPEKQPENTAEQQPMTNPNLEDDVPW